MEKQKRYIMKRTFPEKEEELKWKTETKYRRELELNHRENRLVLARRSLTFRRIVTLWKLRRSSESKVTASSRRMYVCVRHKNDHKKANAEFLSLFVVKNWTRFVGRRSDFESVRVKRKDDGEKSKIVTGWYFPRDVFKRGLKQFNGLG